MAKLLIFGTSDSDGTQLDDTGRAWPWLVGRGLSSTEATTVAHRRFYATAPRALDYLERELKSEAPETIVLSITLYAYSVKTVANRIRRIAGERAGAWAEKRFNWFDRQTRSPLHASGTTDGIRRKLNRAAHLVARRVVGTSSEATAREVFEAYNRAIERLARQEDTRLVVIGSFPFTEAVEARNPKARGIQAEFNRKVAKMCRERRVGWVDPEFMRDRDVEALYSDSLHFTEDAHGRVADEVLRVLGEF